MKKKVILTIVVVILLIISIVFWSITVSPITYTVRKVTIKDEKIPSQLDDVTIAFFTDTHIGMFTDQKRFSKMIKVIEDLHPDVVIFGGDLFDHPAKNIPSHPDINEVINKLKHIEAPLGKFAVFGNHDLEDETSKELIISIYKESDFELLINTSRKLHNKGSQFIYLVGIDSMILGNPNIEEAFQNTDDSTYIISVCHTPDIADEASIYSNYLFAGHSHGGQIYIPIISSFLNIPGAKKYMKGSYKINDMTLDVSNGLGTTRYDVRFLSDSEVVLYTLKHKEK